MAKTVLNIKDLSVTYVRQKILDDFTFSVMAGEIVAIIGANGCGKSTIFKAINDTFDPDSKLLDKDEFLIEGTIDLQKNIDFYYLPQSPRTDWKQPQTATDDYNRASRISRLNRKFSFNQEFKNLDELSDGQIQKVALIDALVSDVDLLLLDEPSNYLDIAGLTALEDSLLKLKAENKAIVLVTHDRTLADNVADRTILITRNGNFQSQGGYQAAWALKSSLIESRVHRSDQLKKRIKDLQQDVRRRMGWSDKKEKQKKGAGAGKPYIAKKSKKMAQRAAAVNKRVEAEIEKLEKEKIFEVRDIKLSFPKYEVKHRDVFSVTDLTFSYSNTSNPVLENISLKAETNDKICLMGENGSGKTTLFKLITQKLTPNSGTVYLHPNVKWQYLTQGLHNFYTKERLLDNFYGLDDESKIRQYLGAVHLRREKVTEPITDFSYGELMRSAIVKCILEKTEFLFLDEPTSHLDIESIEVLESLLNSFQGGYIIISHDRSFVSNVGDKLYYLEKDHLKLL